MRGIVLALIAFMFVACVSVNAEASNRQRFRRPQNIIIVPSNGGHVQGFRASQGFNGCGPQGFNGGHHQFRAQSFFFFSP